MSDKVAGAEGAKCYRSAKSAKRCAQHKSAFEVGSKLPPQALLCCARSMNFSQSAMARGHVEVPAPGPADSLFPWLCVAGAGPFDGGLCGLCSFWQKTLWHNI